MHQTTRAIFDKFMVFGGMACGQSQFTGSLDENVMEDYTNEEIAEMASNYGVSERVIDGLDYEERDSEDVTWMADFEMVAKAFFSSHFLNCFNWYDEDQVRTAAHVLRNFYNYMLLHDVCPEYNTQLLAARKVCDQAEDELLKLREVDSRLPGDFNSACSTLFGGIYAGLHTSDGDWVNKDDNVGWTDGDASKVFKSGVFAHGTEGELLKMEAAMRNGTCFEVVSEEKMGLEVVGIEFASDEAKEVYNSPQLTNTFVVPMGRLRCKHWAIPHAPPKDLPNSEAKTKIAATEELEFLVEDETLKYCFPGLKMEVGVKELDLGIKWIDYLEATYVSFFTWLPNERIRDWKEPGPPKSWMTRQMGGEDGVPAEQDSDEVEGDGEDKVQPD